MHAAATVALRGALAAWGRAISMLSQGKDANTMILLMGAICTLFVYLCIRSFTAARKAGEEEPNNPVGGQPDSAVNPPGNGDA